MGRILGLDIGDKRIGIALSDPGQRIASPHSVYQRVGFGPDTRFFLSLVKQLDVAYIVSGLPYNMDGSLGGQARKVQALCDKLREAGLEVRYMDERLSTWEAEAALIEGGMRREDRRGVVDKVAAALILQSYLDAQPSEQDMARGGTTANKEDKPVDEHNKDLPETEVFEEAYDEDSNIVELTDEDGVTTAFEYQATIELDGNEYVVLMAPPEDEDDEDEGGVVIMKIDQDEEGEDIYVPVEDEALLQEVFDLFLEHLDEEEEGDFLEDDESEV